MTFKISVLDFETTGVDPEEARIVTAYFGVLSETGEVIEGHDFMVQPQGFEIPEEATAIHGVTTEQALAEGKPLRTVLSELGRLIRVNCGDRGLPLGGHNLAYDLTVFDREAERVFGSADAGHTVEALLSGVAVLDSLVLDKQVDKFRKGKRNLITAAEHYGVALSEEEAHGAQADAIASGRITQAILQDPILKQFKHARLHQMQVGWKATQAASLQKYFREKADPLQPDAIVNGEWPFIARPITHEEGQHG